MRMNSQVVNSQPHRKGAMLFLVLALLVIVLAMVVYSVDVAFMQLARSELRAAVDAAAKAAAGELTLSNGDKSKATARGILAASENTVAGQPLLLDEIDFEFGQSLQQPDQSWTFVPNLEPYSAVRVTAEKSSKTKSGPVKLFFAPLFGSDTFSPTQVAVASQFKQEIVLSIDRSHSMAFDESGTDWTYPSGVQGIDFNGDRKINSTDTLLAYPDPYASRWAQLTTAVDHFVSIVEEREQVPNIGLVTWGSSIGTSSYEYRLTRQTVPAVMQNSAMIELKGPKKTKRPMKNIEILGIALDPAMMFDFLYDLYPAEHTEHGETIMAGLFNLGNHYMHGGTNASAGIDAAVEVIEREGDPDSKKVIVLMTDGQWNQGRDPVEAAKDAKAKSIIVHTITFLDAAEQSTMIEVATITGGRHYHASDASQLKAIFQELALSIPVALTN